MQVTIYHNPRCSKSRAALALLETAGVQPDIVHYLETPLAADRLETLLAMFGREPRDLMRTKEAPYAALDLGDPKHSREALVAAMVANPILIERPIVVVGGRAALGRPPETVLDLL